MKVTLDREGKNLVKLSLELEANIANRAYEQACRHLSNKVNIPGFRRGKVPRQVLEKTVGVEYIKQETLDRLLPEVLNEAIVQEGFDIITQPEVESCQFDLGQPLKFQAKFEVRPTVNLGEYKGIKVDVPLSEFEETNVEEGLQSLASARAELTAIESRPLKMGDTVLLDFECLVDGKLVEGGKAEGMLLEVKPQGFLEGFCEQLVDKEPGKDYEIKANFPADYRNQQLAGKEANFKTKIRELRQKVTPAIDEEFAKKLGLESLAQLKDKLRENLKEEFDLNNEAHKQKAVVEAIVKGATVDLPETMIEREQKLLLEQLKHYMEHNRQSYTELENSSEFEKIKESKYEEATQRVLTSLVLGAIIKAENITASEEEMENHLHDFIARMGYPPEKALEHEGVRRQAFEELLTAKVVEFLLQNADINYIKTPLPGLKTDKEDKPQTKGKKSSSTSEPAKV